MLEQSTQTAALGIACSRIVEAGLAAPTNFGTFQSLELVPSRAKPFAERVTNTCATLSGRKQKADIPITKRWFNVLTCDRVPPRMQTEP